MAEAGPVKDFEFSEWREDIITSLMTSNPDPDVAFLDVIVGMDGQGGRRHANVRVGVPTMVRSARSAMQYVMRRYRESNKVLVIPFWLSNHMDGPVEFPIDCHCSVGVMDMRGHDTTFTYYDPLADVDGYGSLRWPTAVSSFLLEGAGRFRWTEVVRAFGTQVGVGCVRQCREFIRELMVHGRGYLLRLRADAGEVAVRTVASRGTRTTR